MENKKPTFTDIKNFMRNDEKIRMIAQKEFDGPIAIDLLIKKGIITQEEFEDQFAKYFEAYIDQVAQKAYDSMREKEGK